MQRIRRDKDLAEYLLLTLVETPGGLQNMDVLIAQAIPSWVMGLQLKRTAPEKRPLILALKMEIVAVLYRYFFVEQAGNLTPEPEVRLPPVRQAANRAQRQALPGSDCLWR